MKTIHRLRRRMTLLVSAVLILVTAGIVFMINYMNWHNIASQAESALKTLAENSGVRPGLSEDMNEGDPGAPGNRDESDPGAPGNKDGNDPGVPSDRSTEGISEIGDGPGKNPAQNGEPRPEGGQPPQIRDALATLSNYYVVSFKDDGSISSWSSDRAYLYSDEQVADMTALVIEKGTDSGRIGSQFYTVTRQQGQNLLIVLDERLELMAAGRVLRTSALIAAIACLILCICAWLLIRFMVRPVQDAFERQRQFVWDAGHELKTPLAVIGANAQVLQGEIGENESLSFITDEVKRTNRMIQNLLMLARTDQGSVQAKLQEIDLGEVVLGAVLPMESTAFDAGKMIESDIGERVRCKGDEDMVRQLTVILLSNALKYSDAGTAVQVHVAAKGRNALLQVADTGEGIAPADRAFAPSANEAAPSFNWSAPDESCSAPSARRQIPDNVHGFLPDRMTQRKKGMDGFCCQAMGCFL